MYGEKMKKTLKWWLNYFLSKAEAEDLPRWNKTGMPPRVTMYSSIQHVYIIAFNNTLIWNERNYASVSSGKLMLVRIFIRQNRQTICDNNSYVEQFSVGDIARNDLLRGSWSRIFRPKQPNKKAKVYKRRKKRKSFQYQLTMEACALLQFWRDICQSILGFSYWSCCRINKNIRR